MKKLLLSLLIAAIFVSFVSTSFAQRGRGGGGRGNGTGTCPRLSQSLDQKPVTCLRMNGMRTNGGINNANRGNRPNRPNNPNRQRIMDQTNPNCPYNMNF
jgi:hypothetical protein